MTSNIHTEFSACCVEKMVHLVAMLVMLFDQGTSEHNCLTWEMNEDKILFTCTVEHFSSTVNFIDQNGNHQAECSFLSESDIDKCISYNKNGNIKVYVPFNKIIFSIKNISNINVNGEWKCTQDEKVVSTFVSLKKGIIAATDLNITGTILNLDGKTVNITCFSCRKPFASSVEFLFNHVSTDSIRYNEDTKECRHIGGKCISDVCSCSPSGNMFSRTFKVSNLSSNPHFACDMMFSDKVMSSRFSVIAKGYFNATNFINNGTTIDITKAPVRDDSKDKTTTVFHRDTTTMIISVHPTNTFDGKDDRITVKIVKYTGIGILSLIPVLLIIGIICVCSSRKFRKKLKLDSDHLMTKLLPEADTEVKTTEIDDGVTKKDSSTQAELIEELEDMNAEKKDSSTQAELIKELEDMDEESQEYNDSEQNIYRLVLFIMNIGMEVLRTVIKIKLLNSNIDMFDSYLNENMHGLFHSWHTYKKCCRCNDEKLLGIECMATKERFNTLYETNGEPIPNHCKDNKYCLCSVSVKQDVYKELNDVSVALWLLNWTADKFEDKNERKSVLAYTSHVKDQRNEIFTLAKSKNLSGGEFLKKWHKLTESVMGLALFGGSRYSSEINKKIQLLKIETFYEEPREYRDILEQCKQEMSFIIHQLHEQNFNNRLIKAGVDRIIRVSEKSIQEKLYANTDNISINIVHSLKEQDLKGENALDVLLHVQVPNEWDEEEIIETIRRMCDQINKGGNIIIKETSIDQFLMICEMVLKMLHANEKLANDIKDLFRKIFEKCENIDVSLPASINVSVDPLKPKTDVTLDLVVDFKIEIDDSFITSCAIWTDEKFIIVDRNNKLLIVYSHVTQDYDKNHLFDAPFSMALLENDKVILSFPARKEVHSLDLKSKNAGLQCCKKLDGECYTLYKKDETHVFVYIQGKGIHILNIVTGDIMSLEIEIPDFNPTSDEICFRNDRLYHTIRSEGSVYCYKINASHLKMCWKYNENLKCPTALTCDLYGNVYVCDYRTSKLLFISSDGNRSQVLLTSENRLKLPTFISFSERNNRLLIANRDNGHFACYQIVYK